MGSLFQHMCKLIHGDRLKIDFVDEAVEDMNNKGQSRLYMPVACGEWIDGVIKRLEREDDDSNCNKAQQKEIIQKYTDDGCKAQTIIKNPAAAGRTAVKTPMQNITSTETHQKKDIYKPENGNRTKIKEDCDFPAIQKLERGKYNENDGYKKKHKNHKTGLFPLLFKFMLCGSVILCGASASHTNQRVTKRLLTSNTCSLRKFYSLTPECHQSEFRYNTTILNCQFRELCNSHENPVCLETENMVVFVCLKRDISCEKGRMIKASQNVADRYIVHLEEVNCPNGTFQPTDSDCINACSYRHMDVADMDERYVLSSKGDNISPTYVYCNYKKGYFNRDGRFNLNYDQDAIVISDICMHINDSNPCKKGKYPLPDGLCVSECEHGFDRNPPDFFCRPMESSVNISTTTSERTITQGTSLTSTAQSSTEGIDSTNFTGMTRRPPITDDKDRHTNDDDNQNSELPWWAIGLIVFVAALVIVAIAVILSFVCTKTRQSPVVTYNIITNIEDLNLRIKTDELNLPGDIGLSFQPGNDDDDQCRE